MTTPIGTNTATDNWNGEGAMPEENVRAQAVFVSDYPMVPLSRERRNLIRHGVVDAFSND